MFSLPVGGSRATGDVRALDVGLSCDAHDCISGSYALRRAQVCEVVVAGNDVVHVGIRSLSGPAEADKALVKRPGFGTQLCE